MFIFWIMFLVFFIYLNDIKVEVLLEFFLIIILIDFRIGLYFCIIFDILWMDIVKGRFFIRIGNCFFWNGFGGLCGGLSGGCILWGGGLCGGGLLWGGGLCGGGLLWGGGLCGGGLLWGGGLCGGGLLWGGGLCIGGLLCGLCGGGFLGFCGLLWGGFILWDCGLCIGE